ncbi:hypothetical protein [Chitinophaga qingshengii]|uniref:Uncharacterized protein n=1 Tax=Chitinophaga qingshengii TaxID=1569794 RepID=A0ABR7TWE9_9BACT|nr:hypothetical protein [Chitinophaga qingshengii]MBC9933324.1 hypothetical protein [Chitinophaga qingshengii]
MGLFSKKAGGTFFGNLLRGVGSAVSGGLLGKGMSRIEVGQTKTNRQLMKEAKAIAAAGGTPMMVAPPTENKVTTTTKNVVGSLLGNGSSSDPDAPSSPGWQPIQVDENGKARLNLELPQVPVQAQVGVSPLVWVGAGLAVLLLLKK